MSGPFGQAGPKPSWYHGQLDRHLAEVKLHVCASPLWLGGPRLRCIF